MPFSRHWPLMRKPFPILAVCAHCLAYLGLLPLSLAAADDQLSFNRDIRPILSSKCFACHGFDAKKRQADLRLDTSAGATADHDGLRAIVAGDLAKSELWRRVTSNDPDEVMPPPDSKKTLTADEKALLKRWIEQGAKYQKHWAFEPIQRPQVPQGAVGPAAIDAFINERLRAADLTMQPEADGETLMRRVSFALTGLPPTLEDLDRFQNRYEAYVDHLLSSQRYGEEMARHWLDVARYADTHGLHLDNERQMWAYRDWVVKAFNDNLPYDKFTVWQVAGDLLPNPTTEQLVATGFNRCNVTTSEGGSIAEEYVYRYAVERATAVTQAWLGLTAGCAVCHDHKYDPISMKEFYSLYAFFHSNADPAMDGNSNVTAPFLKLPNAHQKTASAAAAKVEREARSWLETLAGDTTYVDPADAKESSPRKPFREVLFDDAFAFGSTTRSSSRNAIAMVVDPPFKSQSGRRAIKQAFASTLTDTIDLKLRPVVVPHASTLEAWIRVEPLDVPASVSIGIAGTGKGYRAVAGKSAKWVRSEGNLVREGTSENAIVAGDWTKLSVPLDDLGLKPGDTLTGVSLVENGGVCYWDNMVVRGEAEPANDPLESLTAWRKAIGKTPPPELPAELNDIVKAGPDKKLSEDETAKLRRFYVALVARPVNDEIAAAREAWEAARVSRIIAEESAPGTFVFRDLEKPRESFVMVRGQYDKPGEKVEPNVPAILPPIKKSDRLTRLDLAEWLVSSENPLTARVATNRLWQQLFGTGLVKTSYDFGSQGEPPSHPELLDWLAADFREGNWDLKRFVKQLVMTQAFRRHAGVTPDMLAKDPQNRLHARGPRLRLDAEQVRDNALFVSGLINLQVGGPGVKPYQPPNIWEPVGYSDSNTRFYLQDHGPALYRRSLYVFLKRTAPPPFMSNFDGPNREQVCVVRERSNTPLQALQLMNDPQHFEAARALAERALAEGGSSDESRITWLYRTVLSRRPASDELAVVLKSLAKQRQIFTYNPDPAAADKAIRVGESTPKGLAPPEETAAWTMVANLMLNLDEAVCRN